MSSESSVTMSLSRRTASQSAHSPNPRARPAGQGIEPSGRRRRGSLIGDTSALHVKLTGLCRIYPNPPLGNSTPPSTASLKGTCAPMKPHAPCGPRMPPSTSASPLVSSSPALKRMWRVLYRRPPTFGSPLHPVAPARPRPGRGGPHGLVFGADTSTSDVATLGGMVGNNSAGIRSLVYGMTSDQVLGLRCVLASGETVDLASLSREEARGRARHADTLARLLRGAMEIGDRYNDEIRRRFPKMIRRVSGYGLDALVDPESLDLTRLVCGSEGTLAMVT